MVTIVDMRGITKSFNGVRVLDDVDFEVSEGEVHALVGGNGAGKSTLMKILEGVYAQDAGTIFVSGREVAFRSSHDARSHGIAMIFQEFSLVPTLTVAQNIYLTREARTKIGFLDDRRAERKTRELFAALGVDVDPRLPLNALSTGHQQLAEIAKALSQNARLLIMDEPTASLTKSETDALFAIIRSLKRQGYAIIYISHRMEEILTIADRITVLRDGKKVTTQPKSEITMEQLIEHIVGKKMEHSFEWQGHDVDRSTEPILELHEVVSCERVNKVNLQLNAGEVVGLVGLMGSGRTELLETMFGMHPITSGEMRLRGKPVHFRSPKDAIGAGIVLIPEDRRIQGLVMDHAVKDNYLLPLLAQFTRLGLINDRVSHGRVETAVNELAIRTDSIYRIVRQLSGGNQQKVVIGKWLGADPDILLMDEPTAGVDIGAKTEIIAVIRRLSRELGKGVILVSSELPELLAVSDRILHIHDGRVEREVERSSVNDETSLHHLIQGNGKDD